MHDKREWEADRSQFRWDFLGFKSSGVKPKHNEKLTKNLGKKMTLPKVRLKQAHTYSSPDMEESA